MVPYVICYNIVCDDNIGNILYDRKIIEKQKMVIMANSKEQAVKIFCDYTSWMSSKRCITDIIEFTDNMCVILDEELGHKVHVYSPAFCEEIGVKFKIPEKWKV